MKTLIFSFFFLIFISSLVSSQSLSISPTQIDFIGDINEEICNEITIKTSMEQNLIGEDRWAKKGETRRKFLIHNLSSEKLSLTLNYNRILTSTNNTKIGICLEGKKEGIYHGLLLYRIDESSTGAGIWMNVSLINKNPFTKITGKIIEGTKQTSKINLAIILSIFLITIFVILVFKLRKKPKTKSEFSN